MSKETKAEDAQVKDDVITHKHTQGYRKDYLSVQFAIIVFQLAVIASLALLAVIQFINRPPTIHFYENAKGQIITPKPLNEPGMTNAALSNWVIEGIMAGTHFNVINYERALESVHNYFSDEALESFIKSFKDLGITDAVNNLRMVVDGRATGAPEILNEGVVNGIYSWHMTFPIKLYLRNEKTNYVVKADVEILVGRVPELISPMGVLVQEFRAESNGLENEVQGFGAGFEQ